MNSWMHRAWSGCAKQLLTCRPQVMAGRGQGLGQRRSYPVQQGALAQQKPSQWQAGSLPVLRPSGGSKAGNDAGTGRRDTCSSDLIVRHDRAHGPRAVS